MNIANAADGIQEYISHSWYDYSGGKKQGLHPYDGETKLMHDPQKPIEIVRHPQLRPLHRLRGACERSGGRGTGAGESALKDWC